MTDPYLKTFSSITLPITAFQVHRFAEASFKVKDELGNTREGACFVSMPTDLATLFPGSQTTPSTLIEGMDQTVSESVAQSLLSTQLSSGKPLFVSDRSFFKLQVWHGSTNTKALTLTRLATQDLGNVAVRASYQDQVVQLMHQPLHFDSLYDWRIVEDCIASGDTILGVLACYLLDSKIQRPKTVRIDVVVATVQGLLAIAQFAQAAQLMIELHVGFLAYGLSKGEEIPGLVARRHANYIIYPQNLIEALDPHLQERLLELKAADGNCYVVGDMGDAFKSLPQDYDHPFPWNQHRDDPHGERGRLATLTVPSQESDRAPIHYYFANGGYLMQALVKYWQPRQLSHDRIVSAKRIWSNELGYGVLIKE